MTHQPLVIGNWKMNPPRERAARTVFSRLKTGLGRSDGVTVAVCPPAVFLPALKREMGRGRSLALGAQDCFWKDRGSHTGQLSPAQLTEYGARFVLLGHSERRTLGETDEQVARKVSFALRSDLDAVLCVGEHQRDEDGQYLGRLEEQISASLSGVSGRYLGQLTVAYEPLWAIGGERAMESTEIHEMVVFIRRALSRIYGKAYAKRPRIIYGGSVNADNIRDIIENGEVDGVLPGRASRDPEQFREIVQTVRGHYKKQAS